MMRDLRNIDIRPMIVAVDGSAESASALRWASQQAQSMGCELRVITCYRRRHVKGETPEVSWESFESTKREAEFQAQEVIDDVLGGARVEHVVALGPVESVLIDHSRDASMIVLGTRSSFTAGEGLRSSTTDRITGRVTCPVVSIPLEAQALQVAS